MHASTYPALFYPSITLGLLTGKKKGDSIPLRTARQGYGLFFDWTPSCASPDSGATKHTALAKCWERGTLMNADQKSRRLYSKTEPLRKMGIGA